MPAGWQEVLDRGREEALVPSTKWTFQPELVEAQYALEVGEQTFFPVGGRICQESGYITRIFVEHFPLRRVRAALRLEGAALAIRLARSV